MAELSVEARRQKRIAIGNRDRANWIVFLSFIAYVGGMGFFIVSLQYDLHESTIALALLAIFVGSILVGLLCLILNHLKRPHAQCPLCGNDWEIDERAESNMLTWRNCPSCGLDMSEGPSEGHAP